MAKVNSLLTERLKMATEKLSKMANLAEMSSAGNLSSFSGLFKVSHLSQKEQEELKNLLHLYSTEEQDVQNDFTTLANITSEVKAINSQAALLHGERIKKAQEILKSYKDGAFSAWLIATYGNRQTPYNFLQYFELYYALPQMLLPKLDEMPKQAIYTLASRDGPLEKKEEIIRNYNGETKEQVIHLIRKTFPLKQKDKRAQNVAQQVTSLLLRVEQHLLEEKRFLSLADKKAIKQRLKHITSLIEEN